MAALRETFEETGVLLARGSAPPDAAALHDQRDALLEDRATLHDLLTTLELRPDFTEVVQIAHWITPLVEPRRYDTRFFLAAAPAGASASHDAREMSDALWIRPRAALERFRAGGLRMVFPTVHTLEMLAGYHTVAAALDALRGTTVRAILPRLVRSDGGVRTVIDEENDT
jgi:8-oxo-dGTP pyrophosphatase MutT (NUDIX family)